MIAQQSPFRKVPRKQRKLPARAVHLKHRPISAYMRVDHALIDEYWKQISLIEKAVLIAVLRLVDRAESGAAVVSVRNIVEYAGIAPNSARIGLDDLTARGVVVMVAPATKRQGATYSMAYPKIAVSPADERRRRAGRPPRRSIASVVSEQPAAPAPDAPATVMHRLALVSAPEYRPLYDAVQETVFDHDTKIPESRIGKVTRALLELQPPCTPVELQDCAAWYRAVNNSPLPHDKDCPPLIAAAMQDYRARRSIASETGCAHDAA